MGDRTKIDETLLAMNKKYGVGTAFFIGSHAAKRAECFSTGLVSLDMALGGNMFLGGFAKGRISEVFGPEGSGKTSLMLHTIASAQKKGAICAFIDAEHALNLELAEKIGVNTSDLILSQPDCGEEGLEIARTLSSGGADLVVIDSVANLTPRAELDGEIEDNNAMGLQARMMSKALRILTGEIQKSNTHMCFINQIRMKIGVMFGNPETTPGGRALPFYASQRVDIRAYKTLFEGGKKEGTAIGRECYVKVIKNKIAPPFRKTQMNFYYDGGFNANEDLFNAGMTAGVITLKGNTYSVAGHKLEVGKDKARMALASSAKFRKAVRIRIKKSLSA